jgi:hypothetical protein
MAEHGRRQQVHDLMMLYHLCCKKGLYRQAEQIAVLACELDPDNVAAEAAVLVAHRLRDRARDHSVKHHETSGQSKSLGTPDQPAKPPAARHKKEQARKLMQQFNQLFKEGKYQEAEKAAQKVFELHPDSPMAAAALHLAHIQRRLEDCKNARKDGPSQPTPVYDFGPAIIEWQSPEMDYHVLIPKDYLIGVEERKQPCKERAIEKRLSMPISVNFKDTSLGQIIEDLRDLCGLNIVADTAALEKEGVSLKKPLSLKMENAAVKTVLNLLLRQAGLTFVIKDEVLLITSKTAARGKLVSCP